MWWYKGKNAAVWLLGAAILAGSLYLCRKGEDDKMLEYMERKYGETFMVIETYAGQFGKDYTMLKVRSRRIWTEEILVRASGREKTVYQDNYLAYLLRDKIEQRMREMAEPVFGECKVFYKIPRQVFPSDYPAYMEADAFLQRPQSMVRVYVYVKNGDKDRQKQFEQFFASLRQQEYILGGVISYPADEGMYEMITAKNFQRDIYQGYQYMEEAVFSMGEKGELAYLEWKGAVEHRQ
ncbi:MAG: hypothetical protein K2O16_00620 [Lachnospiraceae bacterium]|nr:hypothetical protein [Lachnospiraceae bacterium]